MNINGKANFKLCKIKLGTVKNTTFLLCQTTWNVRKCKTSCRFKKL